MSHHIIADRLKAKGPPSFQAADYMDPTTRAGFEHPELLRVMPPYAPPPRVKINGTLAQQMALFRQLDAGDRIRLFDPSVAPPDERSGLFCIRKDDKWDRLIMDARPPNRKEGNLRRWMKYMASVSPLLNIYLPRGHFLSIWGDDVSDYYYQFLISRKRCVRNVLVGEWPPSLFKDFKCFRPHFHRLPTVCVALNTMAMGDTNAVEFGQAALMSVLLRAGAICPKSLVYHGSTTPRGPYFAGVIIDDHCGVEIVRAEAEGPEVGQFPRVPPEDMEAPLRFRKAEEGCARAHLVLHPDKKQRHQPRGTLWGGFIDGIEGSVRAPLARVLPLTVLTLQIAKLGICSVELLMVVAGSWVSVLAYRRRLMCLMEYIFWATAGRRLHDVLRLSPSLIWELWSLAMVAPLAVSNLRAEAAPWVDAVDASNWGTGHVQAPASPELTQELSRHCLTKGSWTRLLSPFKSWERERGRLAPGEELPEGSRLAGESQAIIDLVQSLSFHVVDARKHKRPMHINLGEVLAHLRAEALAAETHTHIRLVILTDSQVSAGCIMKGRSSSPTINRFLSAGLPSLLGSDLYVYVAWIPSKFNPADDPTRATPLRAPSQELPDCLIQFLQGNTAPLDRLLAAQGPEPHAGWEQDPGHGGGDPLEALLPESQFWSGPMRPLRARAFHALGGAGLPSGAPSVLGPWLAPADGAQGVPGRPPGPWHFQPLGQGAREALAGLPRAHFVLPRGTSGRWSPTTQGVLDLFSGSKRFAQRLVLQGAPWVLTYDLLDDRDGQDLMSKDVQDEVARLVSLQCFWAGGAGPVCSSFSVAVQPPVRTPLFPEGLPPDQLTPAMAHKVAHGNALADWTASLILSSSPGMRWWVENPDGSWMWRRPLFETVAERPEFSVCRLDYCRFGTHWRKRTRFLNSLPALGAQRVLCLCSRPHTILRGHDGQGRLWTKVAEPYPIPVAASLAQACLEVCRLDGPQKVDLTSVSRRHMRPTPHAQ